MKARLSNFSTANLLTAIVFIAIFTMAVRRPVDTDTWWHLRSGQYLIENRTIFLTTDPFSHPKAGELWINHSWLAQIFWYAVFAGGGWTGLSLGLALLVTGAFGLMWQVTPGNLYIRAFATILGAVASSLIWAVRPQMISFVLAALVGLLLERHKRTGSRGIYSLPLITLLWANVHGGYAIAFMLLSVYVVGESLNHLTQHRADPVLSRRQIISLLGLGFISFLIVVINPQGQRMWTYPFLTVGIGPLREFIQEWGSPNFHLPVTWPFVVMLALTLTAMGRASRRVDWSDLSLVGLWSVWSFFAVRNIGLYGLLTAPVLARYGDAAFGRYLPQPRRRQPRLLKSLNWLILGLLLCMALTWVGLTLAQNKTAIEKSGLPVGAVEFIRQNQPPGPLFNSYNWGGYLLFKLWPAYPVYIDGRTDLYQAEFIRRYLAVMAADDSWRQILDEDGVNLVLVERRSAIAQVMAAAPDWREIYGDDLAVLFERRRNSK